MDLKDYDDVMPMLKRISDRTGSTPEQVLKNIEKIAPEMSMEALARLEREANKPHLSLVSCSPE